MSCFVYEGLKPELKKRYTDDTANDFHKTFNGIYITTDFGSASMLYIRTILMRYYFHYTYKTKAANAVPDSAKLIMYYYSWFGDKYSPMEVNIYEMNKGKTFNFTGLYRSDIDINEYSDKNIKLGGRIFTVKDAVITRPDSSAIEFPLSQDFVQRFSPELKKRYTDDTANDFHKTFNGI